jgi:general secretion pathway protein M
MNAPPARPFRSRQALLVALALLLLVGGVIAYAVSKHVWAVGRLAELEPRHARLLGIEASGPALDKALIERRALFGRHAYASSQDVARAGSEAQQRVREVFTKAGLEVSSTQVLPAKAVDGFDRIPLVIRVDGDLAALQSALVVLPAQSPSLFVEALNIQTSGTPKPDGAQRLSVQINLFVLRARS